MSLTRKVPAAVPLLSHNSFPWMPSLAEKKTRPLTSVISRGFEPKLSGLRCPNRVGVRDGKSRFSRSSRRKAERNGCLVEGRAFLRPPNRDLKQNGSGMGYLLVGL